MSAERCRSSIHWNSPSRQSGKRRPEDSASARAACPEVTVHQPRIGAPIVLGKVGQQETGSRKDTGVRRHDDGRDRQIFGHSGRMQRAGAAERHQDIIARIAATFGGDPLDGAHDTDFGKTDHAVSDFFDRQTEPTGQWPIHPASRIAVNLHAAARKCIRSKRTAPTTPAAGPENSAEMALRAIASAGIRPPLDCMMLNRPAKPRSARAAENRLTYPAITGCTYAESAVVEARSYSRNSRVISFEQVSGSNLAPSAYRATRIVRRRPSSRAGRCRHGLREAAGISRIRVRRTVGFGPDK